MNNKLQRVAALTAFAALIGSSFAVPTYASQAPPPSQSAPAKAPDTTPVVGELTRVNPDAKTIGVKTANGVELVFNYTDATMVSGAEKSVAGLATMSGAQLTITYKAEGSNNVATKIEVRNKT
jgi:hypothetical protein